MFILFILSERVSLSVIVIYTGPDACQHCLGWKQIANSDDGESWKYWAELPSPENFAVQVGVVFPTRCPRCQGSGREPSAADRSERLHGALVGLQAAWDSLGRCVDEFEPSDMSACAAYRDALDTAILAVLTAWKEST